MTEKNIHDVWLYHPEQGAKIFPSNMVKLMEKRGWVDTPAKFKDKDKKDK